jgi:DNA-directed RNA polymerase specialized sigma24 family protein
MTAMSDQSPAPRGGRGFPSTSWTLLSLVRAGGAPGQDALALLLTRYHAPVKAFIRSALRLSPDDVDDAAHDFFADKILSGRLLLRYDRSKGSFRPYLKEALRNYVRSRERGDHARRRQPDAGLVHPDQKTEGWSLIEAPPAPTPEAAFHSAWVRSLLDDALREVREQCDQEGLGQHYAVFAGRYLSDDPPPKWSDLAAPFGWDEKQARNRADIVAARFRKVLTELVSAEVGSEQMAREELEALMALL